MKEEHYTMRNNEDYYYESMDGIHWYAVEPEEEN